MNWGRLATENYRGLRLPRILGLVLAGCTTVLTVMVAIFEPGSWHVGVAGWGALTGSLLVFAAGTIDDLHPIGPRGFWNHLRSLAAGHMTTGVLKMVVTGGAAILVVALQPSRPAITSWSGAVLIAACANLWNGLDVAPGRAIKFFLVVATLVMGTDWSLAPVVPIMWPLAVCVLVADLRERAMLGDGGANLLGFVAGIGLYLALPDGGVAVAAAGAVALNVAADTVTLSRLIDSVPPLRWFDRLGRVRLEDHPA